jgi:hypothetical protein
MKHIIKSLLWVASILGINTKPIGYAVGASYDTIATTTLANYVVENPSAKQALWIERVLDTNGANYQTTPFADGMTGRIKVGKPANDSHLKKAVVEITDTSKVRGDTINIFSTAGIGGEGATGDAARNGTEAQIISGNFQVTIGNQLFSVGYKQSAVDKSMLGKSVIESKEINDGLRNLHCKRKNDTIIYRMLQNAHHTRSAGVNTPAGYGSSTWQNGSVNGGDNFMFPAGVLNREALRSSHTVDLPLIMNAGDFLPGLGAQPMDTTNDSGGSVGELFMFFASDKALFDLEADPTLTQVLQYGWDRGVNNPIFAGGFTKIRGHGLYRWIHRDHANFDSIGSPLLPRAKLSVATTDAANQELIGGGALTGAATNTTAQWFKHFDNAAVVMYGGAGNIAATTATTRYVLVVSAAGYSIFSYETNSGYQLLDVDRVASTCSYVHPVGSIVVQCNSVGTILGRSLMFGQQAVVGGNGSINGNVASPEMGRMVRQELDMQNDISIGVEGCAGYQAVSRAGDGGIPGFVVIEHAISPIAVPGAPTT